MPTPTPRRLRELRDAVAAYREAYGAYLDATLGANPDDDDAPSLRTELNRLSPRAQEGLAVARLDLTVYPPPAVGGPAYTGLRNVAFLHERPGWRRFGITARVRDVLEAEHSRSPR